MKQLEKELYHARYVNMKLVRELEAVELYDKLRKKEPSLGMHYTLETIALNKIEIERLEAAVQEMKNRSVWNQVSTSSNFAIRIH